MNRYSIKAFTFVVGIFFSIAAYGDDHRRFRAVLSGAQEVVFDDAGQFIPGGTETDASGRIRVVFNPSLSRIHVILRVENLAGGFTAAHFHCGRAGENGPVPFGLVNPGPLELNGKTIRGTLTNEDFTGADCVPNIGRPVNNIAALAFAMKKGLIYTNVHTEIFPPGEVRGQMRGKK